MRILLGKTTASTRLAIAAVGLFAIVARLTLVVTAREIGKGDVALSVGAGIVVAAATALLRVAQGRARVGVEQDLDRAAARALLEADVLRAPARDLQQAVFDGELHARSLLAIFLPGLVADVTVCIAATPILATALPMRVLGIAVAALVVVFGCVLALRRVTQSMQRRTLDALQRVIDGMLVAIEGRVEVVARGGEDALRRDLDGRLAEYARVANTDALRTAVVGRLPLVAGLFTVALVVVADGGARDALGVAVLGEALLLASMIPPALGAAMGGHDVARATARALPLVEILGAEQRREVKTPGAPPPAPPFDVAFEGVSFRYADDAKDVLENVSVEWPKGRALVVTGPNGAGKSTILRLLLGLRPPCAGKVTVGGVSIATIDVVALRRSMAYLPQRPYLGEPYTTVREAIAFAHPDAREEATKSALERVAILSALGKEALERKLGTLSAGQRQRVALARVLMGDARVIVLDEPDADLDREGIAMVAALVEELTKEGRMVAVAAHSPELQTKESVRVELA